MTSATWRAMTAVTVALGAAFPGASAEAQLGGLIKKKAAQLTQVASAGEPVEFNDAVLELTPDRIAKVIAGKTAARRLAAATDGPNAIAKQLDEADARQAKIYEKQVGAINAWDEKRRDAERCLDSVLVLVKDKLHLGTDAAYLQRMTQLSLRMAEAQQRGDTAEVRRVTEEVRRAGEPSPADSARARLACPVPPAPPAVQEWMTLNAEVEKLRGELRRAEQAVRDTEEKTAGMNSRQLGIACERILMFLAKAKAKQPQRGFTSEELVALESAAKELQGVCG